jgi:hypothetical protein
MKVCRLDSRFCGNDLSVAKLAAIGLRVIPSATRNLALVLSRLSSDPLQRRARFLAALGMTNLKPGTAHEDV